MLMPIRMGTTMAAGRLKTSSVTEFFYESVNSCIQEFKNIKVIAELQPRARSARVDGAP